MKQDQRQEVDLSQLIQDARQHLTDLRYMEDGIRQYGYVWERLRRYAAEKNQTLFSLSLADEFLHLPGGAKSENPLPSRKRDVRSIQVLTDFWLHGIIFRRKRTRNEKYPAHEKMFTAFEVTFKTRGLAVGTIRQLRVHLYNFSKYLAHKNIEYFSEVDAEIIQGFILTLAPYAKHTISYVMYALKSFLRFAYENGYNKSDLSVVCPKIKYNSKSAIPSAFTQAEITAVLSAVDRGNPAGKRDYAILSLATRLGLRAGEIRDLQFEHFKWETHRLEFVQPKTQRLLNLPLLNEVGWALIDYIRFGRPAHASSKYIFVRHNAPFDRLGDNDNLHHVIGKYIRKAGITVPKGKRHGLHSLRHSLASALLVKNTPMTIIAGVMNHPHMETTNIYLKIDETHLKECALEVAPL